MSDPITPQDVIDAAKGPKSASADGVSRTERDISELIEADKYASAKAAGVNPVASLFRVSVIMPPAGGSRL